MTGDHFTMVSEWMTNGNINEFVATHPHENRFELVSPPCRHQTPSLMICDSVSWETLQEV